jgi:ring-1,2-phenylacetyl-CoA epoxidase subunit PaaE
MTTPHFHPLRICDVRPETSQAVSLAFEIPPELAEVYRFRQGQFITLRTLLDGQEIRRSYSICAGLDDGELRVAIKRVAGGSFSNFALDALRPGATVDVFPPEGRFHTPLDPAQRKHYVAFAAGSGITPVLSHARTILAREPASRFTLVYGNRARDTTMFFEALEDLKDRYLDRLQLFHVFSREHQEIPLFNGHIDRAKCAELLETLIPPAGIDEAFVCGPDSMIDEVIAALVLAGVAREHVHTERFGVPGTPAGRRVETVQVDEDSAGAVEVTVIIDGQRRNLRVPHEGTAILDAALAAGLDLPYACKSGVCCTCRAKLLEGTVRMDHNYTLEEAELVRGFVLTCQSHPTSERVVVSYDER